jgi:ribosomal-protein-alanine N-acetyltransferase
MELITDRLVLRDFRENDWPAVLAYQSDPRYLHYYEWTERTRQAVQEFVGMFLAQQQAIPRIKFQLAVTLKSNHQLIGNCGIRMDTPDAFMADIGYEIAPDFWGQGYATEAAREIMAYGFARLKVHRIWACCNAENLASECVLKKLGMKLEGRLREKEFYKGRWWDTLIFAILEDEWKNRP